MAFFCFIMAFFLFFYSARMITTSSAVCELISTVEWYSWVQVVASFISDVNKKQKCNKSESLSK